MGDLTITDIAERLAPEGDKAAIEYIGRQLRHWTLNGVLEPVEGIHTGRGRHRRYSRESIYMAAVIAELAHMGLPVKLLSAVARSVKHGFKDRDTRLWKEAIEGNCQVLLCFSPRLKEGQKIELPLKVRLHDATSGLEQIMKDQETSYVIVDLTQTFAPLPL